MSESPPPELRDHLALALVPGLGPKLTRALLDRFGSPAAAVRATAAHLETVPQVGAKLAAQFASSLRSVNVDAEWDLIQRFEVRVLLRDAAEYPARLAALPDSPSLLYLRGGLTDADVNAVGIVGSRACTAYGKRVAERIAGDLARAGWTVVSGLARGIDGSAHRGALAAGGRTVAVLAGGLSSIYPPEHAGLADEVAARGALVTETPMTVDPQPGMFPARNRIISGLCRAVVVVEANARSGALITATHAAEQGREVFAVPGNVDSAASAGCLELLRKGARLVRSADDILDDLRGISPLESPKPPRPKTAKTAESSTLFDQPPGPPLPAAPPPKLDPVQQRIRDFLEAPRHADEIARELGLPAGELSGMLMKLELKKVIRRLPGNNFERRT